MKIRKPFVTWEEFEGAIGGDWSPAAHEHVVADITDFDNWIDQALLEASSPTFVTVKLTALTDGYVPYHVSDAAGLANSNIFTNGTKVFIGDTLNAKMTQGLTINQGAADDEILAFKSSDVNHGITGRAETDTYALFKKAAPDGGGLRLDTFNETGVPYSFVINAAVTDDNTAKDSTALAPLLFAAAKRSGTGLTVMGADANLFVLRNYNSTRFIVDEDGDVYAVGGSFHGVTAKLTDLTNGYIPYHISDAAGLANSGIFWHSGNSRVGINLADPDEDLEVAGNIKATEFIGALHWDNITNEPTYYPPEYHYHVGKDIVSLHLVDLDDVEADDIFDVLPTAAIHGEGNYDWWGTWDSTVGAGCSAEIVVLAGDDKYLRLTDGNAGTRVETQLSTAADHPMVIACIQFRIRQSSNAKEGHVYFIGGVNSTYIQMADDGNMKFFDGAALTVLQAYAANTWYTIRIYWDCVSAAVAVWVENVFKIRKDLAALEYIEKIRLRTKIADTGYTLDINNLKVFNLTV